MSKNHFPKTSFSQKIVFALVIIAFCCVGEIKAQLPPIDEPENVFQFKDGFPHPRFGCPYNSCGVEEPETVVRNPYYKTIYDSGGWSYVFDRSLSATFTGGKRMGGDYTSDSCLYGIHGYGVSQTNDIGGCQEYS